MSESTIFLTKFAFFRVFFSKITYIQGWPKQLPFQMHAYKSLHYNVSTTVETQSPATIASHSGKQNTRTLNQYTNTLSCLYIHWWLEDAGPLLANVARLVRY